MREFFESIGAALARFRAWVESRRLPVRIPVPNRDNLIAMGLMSLAMGLMVGVIIGPGLGPAGGAIAGVVSPPVAPVPEDVVEEQVSEPELELGTPAGSESLASTNTTGGSTTGTGSGFPDDPAPLPDVPADPVEAPAQEPVNDIDPEPEKPVKEVPEIRDGIDLKGAVVGVDSNGRRFSVADPSGNVLVLFGQNPPVAGDSVETLMLPLANGTFAETGKRRVTGIRPTSKLRGTISWLDDQAGIAVVSNRGSSLAVDLAGLAETERTGLVVGSLVDGTVAFTDPSAATETEPPRPGLALEKLLAPGDPTDWIEMSGKLETVDRTGRTLELAADSDGLLPASVTIMVPKKFPFQSVKEGRTYDLSVSRGDDGVLTLTGLSPGYSKGSADDSEVAFGDHG